MPNKQPSKKTLRRQSFKTKAVAHCGGTCGDCQGVYPEPVYEFHHLDPSKKDFDPYKGRDLTWEKAVKELDKCIMLCANCHRIRHIQ